jgi:hypothetical protein
MGDYQCIHCNDYGNCHRCSWFFEKDKVHADCGHTWGEHEVKTDPQGFYMPYAYCPKPNLGDHADLAPVPKEVR